MTGPSVYTFEHQIMKEHSTRALFDCLALPIIVTSQNGCVLEVNSAAAMFLRAGDAGLTVRDGRLETTERDETRSLRLTPCGDRAPLLPHVAKIRRIGGPPLRLLVIPLTWETSATAVGIVVLDHRRNLSISEQLLMDAYGLTRAESRVARELMRGRELQEIADSFSISLYTVRSHIRHVLEKTDAANQRELVRMLALEVGSISLDPSTPSADMPSVPSRVRRS